MSCNGISVANGSSLTGTDVRVTGGQVGLIFEDAGGTLDKCEVTGVSDDGIIVRLGADPTIRNSTITGCGFRGIYIYQAAKPTLERCDVSQTGDAGVSVASQSAPTILSCWIHETQGVGVRVGRGCRGSIEACRIENVATPSIFIEDGANPTVIEHQTNLGYSLNAIGLIKWRTGRPRDALQSFEASLAPLGNTASEASRAGAGAGHISNVGQILIASESRPRRQIANRRPSRICLGLKDSR